MRALVLAGVLVLAACGGAETGGVLEETGGVLGETAERTGAWEPITFELRPAEGGGVSGTATIEPASGDPARTAVSVSVEAAAVTLARGSCSSLASAEPAAELDGGVAPFSVEELLEGDFAVVVDRPGAPVSCGDVPDASHIPGEA